MSRVRVRTPAVRPVTPRPASPLADDPSARVVAHFQHVWATAMHDMPFVNPALSVEAVGFARHAGDWLGVVITPWFINLFLLPGGGALWRGLPTGEHGTVTLPVGELEFIGDNPGDGASLAAYQYCPLLSPVQQVPDQATARTIARDALAAVLAPPPVATPATAATAAKVAGGASAVVPGTDDRPRPAGDGGPASLARRGFFRALGGAAGRR